MVRRAESEPSGFWQRMTDAWRSRGLPVTQNGVATKLGMSQGSTRRWYTGEGLPETDTIMKIASLGKVSVDWLLNGTLPRAPVQPGGSLHRLIEIWDVLNDGSKKHVLDAAEGQLAKQGPVATRDQGKSRAA